MDREFVIKDYYGLLGVSPTATGGEIRRAFRAMAMKTHPDVSREPDNHERFLLLREAYEVLSSTAGRRDYDRVREGHAGGLEGGDPFREAFAAFGVGGGERFNGEWEFFVRSPGRYLDIFDSMMRVLVSSAAAFISGTVAALLALLCIAGAAAIAVAAAMAAAAALASTSLAALAVLFMAVRMVRRARRWAARITDGAVGALGGLVARQMEGIPRRTGMRLLHGTYGLAAAFLGVAGHAAYSALRVGGVANGDVGIGRVELLVPIVLALQFAASLPLMFEVVKAAMFRYPDTVYTAYRIGRLRGISYMKDRTLPPASGGDVE